MAPLHWWGEWCLGFALTELADVPYYNAPTAIDAKVRLPQGIPVTREAGARPALPRNCKRNEICEDH